MDYEKKYNEALDKARTYYRGLANCRAKDELENIFPELSESEDERIRKLLIWQVYRNIEDETNDLAQSVYDGIKGHDPDLEESIEDWKKCLAYLEKHKEPENTSASTMAPSCWEVEQKEQKPVEPSDDELQRYQDELYDFKVFATKQAKEHHISFVHDFEWNNFCAGLLSYFNEQKPKAKAKSPLSPHELYDAKIEGISQGRQDVLDHPEQFGLQKPAEWSEEDEDMLNSCISSIEEAKENRYAYRETDGDTSYDHEISWLKSLRPQYHGDVTMTEAYKMGLEAGKASSWKPSEEQVEALHTAMYLEEMQFYGGLKDKLRDLYEQLKKL